MSYTKFDLHGDFEKQKKDSAVANPANVAKAPDSEQGPALASLATLAGQQIEAASAEPDPNSSSGSGQPADRRKRPALRYCCLCAQAETAAHPLGLAAIGETIYLAHADCLDDERRVIKAEDERRMRKLVA